MIVPAPAPRRLLLAGVALLTGLVVLRAEPARAHCGCKRAKIPRCADAAATRRLTVDIDLAVVDGTVEVITQSGPYRMPVADLDGKTVLFIFLPRGETFQGFFEAVIPGSITVGPMSGAKAQITTGPVFAPGEYEMLLFVDVGTGRRPRTAAWRPRGVRQHGLRSDRRVDPRGDRLRGRDRPPDQPSLHHLLMIAMRHIALALGLLLHGRRRRLRRGAALSRSCRPCRRSRATRRIPPTPARRNLGAELFFDTRLSGSGFTSCNNCHVFNTNWQDNLVKPRPDTSQGTTFFTLPFNTESLLNIAYRQFFFRDGRTQDIAHAFTEPWIEDNQQLGTTRAAAATHLATLLRARPGWVARFQRAFRRTSDARGRGRSSTSPARRWLRSRRRLVTRVIALRPLEPAARHDCPTAAERGVALFVGKGRCIACHNGPNFTDGMFHNISTSPPRDDGTRADEGRARVTGLAEDGGKFLTPTLRQVATTAPYFHDGSANDAEATCWTTSTRDATADPNHDPLVTTPARPDGAGEVRPLLVPADAAERADDRPRSDRQGLRRRRGRAAPRPTAPVARVCGD